jgi:hypothetical protein
LREQGEVIRAEIQLSQQPCEINEKLLLPSIQCKRPVIKNAHYPCGSKAEASCCEIGQPGCLYCCAASDPGPGTHVTTILPSSQLCG